jgi:hypothetical protein
MGHGIGLDHGQWRGNVSQDAHRNRLDFDLSPPHRVSNTGSYDVSDEGVCSRWSVGVRGVSLERGIAQQRQISSLIKPRWTFIGNPAQFLTHAVILCCRSPVSV